ncbi:MAG TPA: SRPBCC family protein [Nevskiaceae bacterium]|nr:SRPBCC family protein [Nevskiaceae bacterium]
MSRQLLRFEQFFAAPRETVFAFFSDHQSFGEIWPGRFERIQVAPAGDDPNGLGSVRRVRSAGMVIEETITAFEPPARIEYRVTRGGPLKNHRGELRFTEVPGGTQLDYQIEFEPRWPLTGGLIASTLCAAWHHGVSRAVEAIARR